ncbi:hypothetical protein [Streptomyces formicae]|uniref:Phage protein n=1 Tax=Streptomyces formicae TaxID=1616117 RepID=A0ABY3WIA3_9ACTN|nr:hypothetical protein [Streptomyces formicae]UNM12329.1 hypothetical protein J4032_12990 [Streptomyces formicae]
MSTPIEQYVPPEWQEEIDLPTPGSTPGDAAGAQKQLDARNKQLAYEQRRLKEYEKAAAQKGLSPASKKVRDARVTAAKKRLEQAQKNQVAAQNAYYQASGQYDQLLEGTNRDAFLALQSMFSQMGLGSLAGQIFEFVKQGYGADTIGLLLQDTKEYKERFKANDERAKLGLPVLSPAEYLAAESAYRQILSSSGLPSGFYDNPADFRKWIAGDVSPTEIKSRVDMATEAVNKVDPNYRGALFQMYGVNEGDLAAYFLDRKTAEPILRKQAAAGAIGAAALRRGFSINTLNLEEYASLGLTAQEAEAAYGQIASGFESMLGIASRYGSSWTQRDAEQELFTPGAAGSLKAESAFEKGKRLKSQERAMFSGGRGSSSQGLSAGYRQT